MLPRPHHLVKAGQPLRGSVEVEAVYRLIGFSKEADLTAAAAARVSIGRPR